MDDLLAEFLAETRETLDALSGEVIAWEAEPSDRGRLDAIFRFVHTVKGSCGFLDLRSGTRVADAGLVSAVLAIIDRIGELTEALEANEPLPDSDDTLLIAALSAEAAAPVTGAGPSALTTSHQPRAPTRSIRVPPELLDRIMSGVSDMVLARNELSRRLREIGVETEVGGAFERLSSCVAEMRDSITRTRMQRIEKLFSALPRMVRDTAAELGKAVDLDIAGVALVDGVQVELLDSFWLFSEAQTSAAPADARPLCAIADAEDRWSREILRPLLEAAGYRVAFGADPKQPADVIVADRDETVGAAAPVVRLRRELGTGPDGSVYRYDRAGLLAAIDARLKTRSA